MNVEDLAAAVQSAERAARIAAGLPPDHVLDFAQYPFAFAKKELAAFDSATAAVLQRNQSPPALLQRVMAILAAKDYAAANSLMGTYQRGAPDKPKGRMRFGLTPPPATVSLPEVVGPYPSEPCFFFSCDPAYFSLFCLPLLRSMAQNSPGVRVHLHIMGDPGVIEAARALNLRISSSHENPIEIIRSLELEPRCYYGAVRLIRFAEALAGCAGPMWTADVDALVTRDVSPLLATAATCAARVRPGRLEPWHQFSACLLLGTPASRAYFRCVADILLSDLPLAWWGMDQYALFSAALAKMPEISLLGPDLASIDQDRPGVFWFTAGKKKLETATDQRGYAQLFRSYSS